MNTTQKTALQRAIALLVAAGVEYKVIDSEGNEYGTLEVKRKVVQPERKYKFKKTGIDYRPFYKSHVEGLSVGEVAVLRADNNVDLKNLRAAAATFAIKLYGKANVITAVNDDSVEILRVA